MEWSILGNRFSSSRCSLFYGVENRRFCTISFFILISSVPFAENRSPISTQGSWLSVFSDSTALSLRNLVLGYECGRVVPAGVGLDSPSIDAANWLSSRFSPSVETRHRYGWLRMVFTECASSELQFGALREVLARRRQRRPSRKAW